MTDHNNIVIAGIGGVGSYATEALARSGVGTLTLIDCDTIDETNINRQIHALHSTIGRSKVEVMAERLLDINPNLQLYLHNEKITKENVAELLSHQYQYVVDAVDDVKAKLALICWAKENQTALISSMGTANKLSPEHFVFCDISQTEGCPLARVMRRELRKLGIEKGVEVLFSKAPLIKPQCDEGNRVVGSVAFVPSVAGLMLAGHVVESILENKNLLFNK